jgi:molybdopterin-synthase adenylyltransferase
MNELEVSEKLDKLAGEVVEAGKRYPCLSIEAVVGLAVEQDVSTLEISLFALGKGYVPERYLKNMGTVGIEGQARLLRSGALIVGAGGIGGRAAELLARAGVGRLTVVDPDDFDDTNLNRQDFSSEDVIGRSKAEVVRENLLAINGDVQVESVLVEADGGNLGTLLKEADVAVDGLDNLDDRLALREACREWGVIMVHGAIAGTALQVTTLYPGDPGPAFEGGATGGRRKSRGVETETGNPSTTPAVCAALQAHEAIKVLLGESPALRGKMLYLDLEDWSMEFIDLSST